MSKMSIVASQVFTVPHDVYLLFDDRKRIVCKEILMLDNNPAQPARAGEGLRPTSMCKEFLMMNVNWKC